MSDHVLLIDLRAGKPYTVEAAAAIEGLESDIERLRKTLDFYSDRKNYRTDTWRLYATIEADRGKLARAALNAQS